MKTLIITAHPSSKGLTHKLAENYKKTAEKKGYTITTLNLYHKPQSYLSFEERHDMNKAHPTRDKHQKLIDEANELVFIFPVWWGDCPAIMKNWLDVNFSSGFAFTYENGRPKKLLTGKTARVICTAGAPGWFYRLTGMTGSIKKIWKSSRLGFCGIKLSSFTLLGNMGSTTHRDENKALKIIKRLL